ncbi:SgcJ/EcaC family oxidoreductase [Aurantiacibacter zhengii]|uniref:SgcJ/EcaC family oxidoreductase n=1 Tax=Aurantiacibacter zhengii TaxID=2307003 RepID=UPI0018F33A5F|nr:SgcJ/EcaC family oxidoreductase [Aurantiacibacter zhengii]
MIKWPFDGSTANGPDEIEAHLRPIFSDHPTARFIGKVREVRLVGEDTALLRAVAGIVPPDENHIKSDRNAIQTLVASKTDRSRWMVEMFHNTPAAFHGRPEESKRLTEEFERELSNVGD